MPQDERESPSMADAATPMRPDLESPGGGGGGTPGATMGSRIESVIHELDAAQAADTGGVANEPQELNPVPPPSELKRPDDR